ncbi:MAG: tRNA (adenosine(37)-N6)-dimethylallyltransferase MiaA [bacterium]|nr:tRNA (adenosine(37)-N6)-dimethylallyltransferase MiaA [bacterium]
MVTQASKKTKTDKKEKIIVILGQTATGKSDLAVKLAKKFDGEIISADSRQVYKGLDIGTGKITKKEMCGVPHYMLDVTNPRHQYTVSQYVKEATRFVRYIERKGKVPIIVGGTGFYISALLGETSLPNVPPNKKLRTQLEKKTSKTLFAILKNLDPRRAQTIDRNNKVRLIRALEIVYMLGKVPIIQRAEKKYDVLKIGIKIPDKQLKQKISMRLFARISRGMINEVRRLHKRGLSWKRMEELGMGYRCLAHYLRKKMDKKGLEECVFKEEWNYAKRQKTWFKRDKNIKWFKPCENTKIENEIKKFIIR